MRQRWRWCDRRNSRTRTKHPEVPDMSSLIPFKRLLLAGIVAAAAALSLRRPTGAGPTRRIRRDQMSYRNYLKSKLFRTIGGLTVAGMVLAGVATITAFTASSPPAATLSGEDGGQVITHDFTPNPFEPNTDPKVVADGMIRATWQHRDTSRVWAKVHATDPDGKKGAVTVDTTAIAWVLLDKAGVQKGPTGGDTLTKTTFVQRLNTTGGLAPKTGCSSLTDVGNFAFVPYTADYFFYQKAN